MNHRTFLSSALALALVGAAHASDLTIDGRVSVRKLMGDRVQITVHGGANLPAALFLDLAPGPIMLFGQTIPLGLTPALAVIPLPNTDANGDISIVVRLPAAPANNGAVLYFAAVVVDPSAPSGLDISNGANVQLVDRNIELAGNTLATYPFFEHVAAFNQGSSVEIGIDPTQYPSIVGVTADVYVVASKTRAQWINDPSLTDVRGAPQTVTFSGSNIQSNTFTVDTGTLSGNTGTIGMGVPYDIVIDVDRDGTFDGKSDIADGYSDTEAGFYVVHDLTQPGPYAVTEILYRLGEVGTFRGQDTYYPSNIASLGQLPLVVVSHGNGHNYQWYDHIGYHLASYGYIVMSHENDTMPGSHTAADTTLQNTDAFLGALGSINGGVLQGHVDNHKIVWIGHSRGGDGVVRAYDLLFDNKRTVNNFTINDIVLVSAIAPVDFGGSNFSDPHGVNFSLWVGQADADVNGCADNPLIQPFKIHDRAIGNRVSISLAGVGHDDFHTETTAVWARGPCLIGKANTHLIMKGYLLPLVEHFVHGNIPAKDYLWRQYESFRPIGAPTDPCVSADLMYQEAPSSGKRIIDDFQTNGATNLASSGATVSMTVQDFTEGRLSDNGTVFTQDLGDPFNGFLMDAFDDPGWATRYAGDNSRGCVFSADGQADYDLTYTLPGGMRDVRDFEYLQFRAAQGTRHPLTEAVLGDLTFSVTLEDGNGNRSSINIGAYGGGIEEPYQRNVSCSPPLCCDATCSATIYDCGPGFGWASEFETIRLRLADFLTNGNSVDLADVQKVEFDFGPSWGSAQARLGLDEIELEKR